MNWIASPDDFARHVAAQVNDKYPSVIVTEPESGFYILQESGFGGIAQLLIHPGRAISVGFIKSSPGGGHERPAQTFPYAEASIKLVAQAICEWRAARSREAMKIVDERV